MATLHPCPPPQALGPGLPSAYDPLVARSLLKSRFLTALGLIGLAFTVASSDVPSAHAQDFNPGGRKKPGVGKPGAGKPGTAKPGPGTAKPGPGTAKPGPGTAPVPGTAKPGPQPGEGAPAAVLIERYTKIVLSQPGSPFPLQRLAQLYRDKDGNITNLVKDFEARAAQAGPEQYAATASLAGIYKIDGRADDAAKTFEKAISLKSSDPSAILALARLLQDRGDTTNARTRYEQALALQTAPSEREQTLRTLMTLALDGKDLTAAKGYHAQLVKMQPNSLFVKGELGRELFSRGEFEKAEAELKDLVNAAAGDNRALAPALKDLGKAQAKAHKNKEALATLKKALQAAGAEAAVRGEIYETITELYRADQQLPILIKQLEDEHPNDFARLSLLGSLYEETGDSAKALETYRKALAVNPRHIDLRLKVIRVLQSQGELDKAISEYEGLIRAAPNNPTFVFEQCEALMQRGDRVRALKLLTELEARGGSDEEVLSRLADFYGRIGENEKSMRVLQRLAQVSTGDPGHLVDLGDRYFQDGNSALAIQTWKRILAVIQPRAKALSALGDVYLEHDMTADALASFKEAVQLEPQNPTYKKQLASAYERGKNFREARALWTELAAKAKATNDRLLAREARSRLVTLWGFERVLDQQIPALRSAFNGNPPDAEAGRTLAEVELHLRKLPEAEATLRKVLQVAPGDADSYLALERVLVQENKIAEAILVLEKLVGVEPKRARELYQRMAQYALQIYKDDDAIKYAARAVELNPDDAEGHRRLGDMYRSRQDTDRAVLEYRAAIQKNDRLYIVYFSLADLLLSKGQSEEADRLFRRVIRGAPDEELVARAARLSMQINLGKGTLESLEQDLLPIAIGNPQRTIYRKLLVEIYGNLTFGLVQRVRHGSGKDAEESRAALARIGARAVKPLLDALVDQDAGQQRIAIDVLAYVQNKNAGLPLLSFAQSNAELSLRARAMIASGALRDPALLPKYETLVFPKGEGEGGVASDPIAVAAAWGIAKSQDKRSLPALKKLLKLGTPEMRAFAALGLAAMKDKASVPLLAEATRSLDGGVVARAAAAYALGELGAIDETGPLLAMTEGSDPLSREAALVSLARLYAGKGEARSAATGAMADAVFSSSRERATGRGTALAKAGAYALVLLATKGAADPKREPLPVPEDGLDAEKALEQLLTVETSEKDRAEAFIAYREPIRRSALAALQTSDDRARTVLDALGRGDGTFEPFVLPKETAESKVAREKGRELLTTLEPSIVALARHPDSSLRVRAIGLLSRSSSDSARAAMVSALGDPDVTVQRVALDAVGSAADAKATAQVIKILKDHPQWSMRTLAASALGRLGKTGSAKEASVALQEAAKSEPYALVREAALVALAGLDANVAKMVAQEVATKDAEPRVRETAQKVVKGEKLK